MAFSQFCPQASVVVIVGHYGVGKTNFSMNLALDAVARGVQVTLIDLDVVNPYFRSSDYRAFLEEKGVQVISPVMAGTTLDSPSLSGAIVPAITCAQQSKGGENLLIIDAGGDDVGATALGRFAHLLSADDYEMLYVINRSRNLTQDVSGAVEVLREIEEKSHLRATSIVNNTHLKQATDKKTIERGIQFATEVASEINLSLRCTTVPNSLIDRKSFLFEPDKEGQAFYPVQVYVHTPWE